MLEKANVIENTDSYKCSQFLQYPPNTSGIYSYGEARFGSNPYVVFGGLQPYIMDSLLKPITMEDIDAAEELITTHGEPFNRAGWEYIVKEHAGLMPLEIKAVPEGSKVELSNVLFTVENTDPICFWLTSYVETAILRAVWYMTTVASNSHFVYKELEKYSAITSDAPLDALQFKLHDFGARGVSSEESAGLGGVGHMFNFMGTDNINAIRTARHYYDAPMAGFSIPAAEHSTITSWGKEGEADAYRNMMKSFESPIVAIVSDSYDLDNAVLNIYGGELKEDIVNSGKCIVVRPDSGDPATIVVRTIQQLMDKFGFTTNTKGYLVLPDCIRVIQGDGITPASLPLILKAMKNDNLSVDNIAFGMGGGLLQHCNRDDYGFAMKCSARHDSASGGWFDVYKSPKTDPSKASKKGRLALVYNDVDGYKTIRQSELNGRKDCLQLVYRNGEMFNKTSLDEIRGRVNES